jgi:hypothetical protein
VLGMSKAEIARKFDEIVDFAEVERFLDTPVKHYSSGMYVRLAFAVARICNPISSSWTKSWPSATCASRRNAWANWARYRRKAGQSFCEP